MRSFTLWIQEWFVNKIGTAAALNLPKAVTMQLRRRLLWGCACDFMKNRDKHADESVPQSAREIMEELDSLVVSEEGEEFSIIPVDLASPVSAT
jgi:hypothetical protein